MNRLFFILVLLLICVGALGFYLGWFSFSTRSTDQKTNITVTIDEEKIREDKEKAKAKAQEFEKEVKEKAGKLTGKDQER